MDKIKSNSRLVILFLIVAGVALLMFSSGENNQLPVVTEETATIKPTDTQNQDSPEVSEPEKEANQSEEPAAVTPSDSASGFEFKAKVNKGDNQTVIARQMITEYLNKQSKTLSDEQRIYVETVIVDSMPRNNVVYEGSEIVVAESTISSAVENGASLTVTQLARWATYL